MDRRAFVLEAAALGAALAWSGPAATSKLAWTERHDLYPEGVASGDPEPTSVILWTRRPFDRGTRANLTVEVALDPGFKKVVSVKRAPVLAEADWTCRVLAAGLKPSTVYWYRFVDETGAGSRVGRTITAPALDDLRPVKFAFVSCQSVNEGAQNAYRRMLWEDERAAPADRLGFVLHLGDFIYEVVEYPDEVPNRFGRKVYDLGRVPDARKVLNFHVPTNLAGYRMVYRAHIHDPDIQDARAWLPFVCIGDNHEFSWQGWQSTIQYDGKPEPAQPLRVAANQAWWEFIPSRVRKSSGPGLEVFAGPKVSVAPIDKLDDDGMGQEPNNLAALASMTAYRALRYGRNVEVILTDFHSYRSTDPDSPPEAQQLNPKGFPQMFPEEVAEILDAGRAYNGGKPPAEIRTGDVTMANFVKAAPPTTFLGRVQKAWLKQTLSASKATWKIWGATNGTLEERVDPQNLPEGMTRPWPGAGYAIMGGGDFAGARAERGELYDHVKQAGVTGFVVVSGDRHSFWAGYAAKALPPAKFEPVGINFITGSISAPGAGEALEYTTPKTHPLRALYVADRDGKPHYNLNATVRHGVKSAIEYARSGDAAKARALRNPDLSPHLTFVDVGGHGYSVVTAGPDALETEFVCIPRPITRATTPDGGPLRYRVVHRAKLWRAGEAPKLDLRVIEGEVGMSI